MTLTQLYAEVRKGAKASSFTLGDRLLMLRDLRGFRSQREAAKAIGIQAATLSSYESGRHYATSDILVKIALAYDVSTDWLLGLSEEMERR